MYLSPAMARYLTPGRQQECSMSQKKEAVAVFKAPLDMLSVALSVMLVSEDRSTRNPSSVMLFSILTANSNPNFNPKLKPETKSEPEPKSEPKPNLFAPDHANKCADEVHDKPASIRLLLYYQSSFWLAAFVKRSTGSSPLPSSSPQPQLEVLDSDESGSLTITELAQSLEAVGCDEGKLQVPAFAVSASRLLTALSKGHG